MHTNSAARSIGNAGHDLIDIGVNGRDLLTEIDAEYAK